MNQQFLVEFEIEENPDPVFMELIPQQRAMINQLMSQGKIISYTLSQDRLKLWCVMNAENEMDVLEIIAQFPLVDFMKPLIFSLMFHNSIFTTTPSFSKN